MKHQQVGVDFWAMAKSMAMYGALTLLGWIMLRLFNAVFTLPRRLRTQQQNIQETLQEFQRRYPELNVTEEDLKNAEKEIEEWTKETEEKQNNDRDNENENKSQGKTGITEPVSADEEVKKTN